MCGIFAYLGSVKASAKIIAGLQKLEYRGYDSAGIAMIDSQGKLQLAKSVGYVSKLKKILESRKNANYRLAIGHTRWATHGQVNRRNAHPHLDCSRQIAVVHNGVIENFQELKTQLIRQGHRFRSSTDSEVIGHLIEEFLNQGLPFAAAFRRALQSLVGAWAVATISSRRPNTLWLGRFSSPLAIGLADKEVYASSDARAFPGKVKKIIFLEDGQLAKINLGQKQKIAVFNLDGRRIKHQPIGKKSIGKINLSRGKFDHFMLKEIFEQPAAIARALSGRVDFKKRSIVLGGLETIKGEIKKKKFLGLVACGTSYHAAMIGRLFASGGLGMPSWLANSSDYGPLDIDAYTLGRSSVFYVSQSGETADTLAGLKLIEKHSKALNLGIVNVVGSSLARRVKAGVYTRAGVEIGVAASKTFLNQIMAIILAEAYIGQLQRHPISGRSFFSGLKTLDKKIAVSLKKSPAIRKMTRRLTNVDSFMFLGRHLAYPLALEGALKLKEIAYKFSYGSPLGELKHGPLALVDRNNVAVITIFRKDPDWRKSISNIQEIIARKGRVIVVSDLDRREIPAQVESAISFPRLNSLWLAPFVAAPILQLFAYHLANHLGREIDKPRYLAKSVTVI